MLNPNKQPTVRVRVRFQKNGLMRFVGHLDMMRFFQKAIRRAKLPIAYTNGFHPHQIMSFALPLGIGVTSDGEYMDLEVLESVPAQEAVNSLNAQMAQGVKILSWKEIPTSVKKAMAAVEAAEYLVHVKCEEKADWEKSVRFFYEKPDTIMITKTTKKGERLLDLKPLIYDFFVQEQDKGDITFYLKLSAGSTDNIKPELVMSHFFKKINLLDEPMVVGIHRLDLLGRNAKGDLVSLGSDLS